MQKIFSITIRHSILFAACLFLLSDHSALSLPSTVLPGPTKDAAKKVNSTAAKDTKTPEKNNAVTETKADDAQIANAVSVTTEDLVNKPQEYLNKTVKFDAKFASFSTLALDYKPALRSSRNYLSFLVYRPNNHVPFSEIKLAMLIPKEKDPETHLLQTLKENDLLEITGHVFACPLDEPWLDVLKIKKLGNANAKAETAEDKEAANDKDSDDETPAEKKHE